MLDENDVIEKFVKNLNVVRPLSAIETLPLINDTYDFERGEDTSTSDNLCSSTYTDKLDSIKSCESALKIFSFEPGTYNAKNEKCRQFWELIDSRDDLQPVNCVIMDGFDNKRDAECQTEQRETEASLWARALYELRKKKLDKIAMTTSFGECKFCEGIPRYPITGYSKKDLVDNEDLTILNDWQPSSRKGGLKKIDTKPNGPRASCLKKNPVSHLTNVRITVESIESQDYSIDPRNSENYKPIQDIFDEPDYLKAIYIQDDENETDKCIDVQNLSSLLEFKGTSRNKDDSARKDSKSPEKKKKYVLNGDLMTPRQKQGKGTGLELDASGNTLTQADVEGSKTVEGSEIQCPCTDALKDLTSSQCPCKDGVHDTGGSEIDFTSFGDIVSKHSTSTTDHNVKLFNSIYEELKTIKDQKLNVGETIQQIKHIIDNMEYCCCDDGCGCLIHPIDLPSIIEKTVDTKFFNSKVTVIPDATSLQEKQSSTLLTDTVANKPVQTEHKQKSAIKKHDTFCQFCGSTNCQCSEN